MDIVESSQYQELMNDIIKDGRARQLFNAWLGSMRIGKADGIKAAYEEFYNYLGDYPQSEKLQHLFAKVSTDVENGVIRL